LALPGIAAVTRTSSDLPLKRIVGIGAGHWAIDLKKTMIFAAPLDRVFAFWANYKEFPHYTTHVREFGRPVRPGPAGPLSGLQVSNSLEIPPSPGSFRIKSSRGEPNRIHVFSMRTSWSLWIQDSTTTVNIRMSYSPPGGALSHGTATLFRTDSKTLIEKDLVRIKTVLESGTIPRDVQEPRRGASNPYSALKAEQLEE
jgi:uncharacterized membrane protein